MYKLVIVEDEQDIRSRLASLIAKSGCNFEVIAEYETGIDAYDGIITDNPDLVLTDIMVPYINGIDLSKKIREVYPLIRIVIITGYNEFDYAKEAANLGVIGFISKPVTLDSIRDILKKTETSLDAEFLTGSNLDKLSTFYRENLPIIKENDLYRLSRTSDVTPQFEARLRISNISLDYPFFAICVFDSDTVIRDEADRYDIAYPAIRKIISDELEGLVDFDLFNRYEKLCLILKYRTRPDVKEMEHRIERIILRASRYSDTPISAGISSVYHNDRNFPAMLKEAMRALEYRSVMGGQKVFFPSKSETGTEKPPIDDNMIKELTHLIHTRTADDCTKKIDLILSAHNSSRDSLYYAATGILNILMRACDDISRLYARYGSHDMLYRKLFDIKTDDEIYDYLKGLARTVLDVNNSVIVDNIDRNLQIVTSYLEAHYCDPDISFESLAREVNFSISYISALLRRRLNTSFVKMLTELRMEKAKELLSDPALKIIDIAERLGYSDSYYFSHCFKKYAGIPPREFRSRN